MLVILSLSSTQKQSDTNTLQYIDEQSTGLVHKFHCSTDRACLKKLSSLVNRWELDTLGTMTIYDYVDTCIKLATANQDANKSASKKTQVTQEFRDLLFRLLPMKKS